MFLEKDKPYFTKKIKRLTSFLNIANNVLISGLANYTEVQKKDNIINPIRKKSGYFFINSWVSSHLTCN